MKLLILIGLVSVLILIFYGWGKLAKKDSGEESMTDLLELLDEVAPNKMAYGTNTEDYKGVVFSSSLQEKLSEAIAYRHGIEREYDFKKALKLFSECAREGHPDAMNMAGQMLISGIGVKRKPKAGHQLYLKSAELGCVESICSLGYFYTEGSYGSFENEKDRLTTERDFNKGYSYYQKAIEKGSSRAYDHLVNTFRNNIEHDGSIKELIQLYKWAWEERKWVDALFGLAELYLVGAEVEQSDEKAKEYYELIISLNPNDTNETEENLDCYKEDAREILQDLDSHRRAMYTFKYVWRGKIDTKAPLWDNTKGIKPKAPWEKK